MSQTLSALGHTTNNPLTAANQIINHSQSVNSISSNNFMNDIFQATNNDFFMNHQQMHSMVSIIYAVTYVFFFVRLCFFFYVFCVCGNLTQQQQ